ncbi:MAG: tRNA cyclic N6-threonylcarbamoyladenosine(37) synthase TcdA [Gammaproteobacteria bacterium]|nr:tRNA cyclic N6-threonylcarbamoyladenosine(37) synthase TcdA [Gammaproteobacteria bacterium]NVK89297.1 tRNA cyclic N6-threonylcarbamoyladenosine(37) synthase TcdA [Gammaproteobacteria bacterium]
MSDFDFRFGGLIRLYGLPAVTAFRQAHVVIIGIGGVGSWSAEALARSAVGQITLIDLDDVCTSNINRQIVALDSTVGQSKVAVMAERIQAINPECQVNAIADFITADNLATVIPEQVTVVVDAIDSVRPKVALLAHCKRRKQAVISVGGAGGQIDPGKIAVADLNRVQQDPLLAKVRSELRRHYQFSRNPKRRYGIECIYSTEQLLYPQPDGSVCHSKTLNDGSTRLDCASGFGSATVVTASFGMRAAARALARIEAKALSAVSD